MNIIPTTVPATATPAVSGDTAMLPGLTDVAAGEEFTAALLAQMDFLNTPATAGLTNTLSGADPATLPTAAVATPASGVTCPLPAPGSPESNAAEVPVDVVGTSQVPQTALAAPKVVELPTDSLPVSYNPPQQSADTDPHLLVITETISYVSAAKEKSGQAQLKPDAVPKSVPFTTTPTQAAAEQAAPQPLAVTPQLPTTDSDPSEPLNPAPLITEGMVSKPAPAKKIPADQQPMPEVTADVAAEPAIITASPIITDATSEPVLQPAQKTKSAASVDVEKSQSSEAPIISVANNAPPVTTVSNAPVTITADELPLSTDQSESATPQFLTKPGEKGTVMNAAPETTGAKPEFSVKAGVPGAAPGAARPVNETVAPMANAADPKAAIEAGTAPVQAEQDAGVARSGMVDMSKLEKLAVTRDDVPAITKPLTHPDWGKEVGERIVWMNSKNLPAAELKINPPHLGPITVRIDVNQDQATVTFNAQHGVVRDALEASIPKLREMLNTQNLNLAEVNVATQSSSHQSQSQAQNFFQNSAQQNPKQLPMNEESGIAAETLENGSARVSKGILSMYA